MALKSTPLAKIEPPTVADLMSDSPVRTLSTEPRRSVCCLNMSDEPQTRRDRADIELAPHSARIVGSSKRIAAGRAPVAYPERARQPATIPSLGESLDAVAIGIHDERGIVVLAVVLADARLAVVTPARFQCRGMKTVDRFATWAPADRSADRIPSSAFTGRFTARTQNSGPSMRRSRDTSRLPSGI